MRALKMSAWTPRQRLAWAGGLIGLMSLLAYAEAEHSDALLPTMASAWVLASPGVDAWAAGPGLVRRLLLGIAALVFAVLALVQGSAAQGAAFNRCVGTEGAALRAALAAHQASQGSFPASLNELPGRPLCAAPLTGSIVHYQRTATGYEMWFGSFVTHTATEASDFFAHK